jgi:hypothetical protein
MNFSFVTISGTCAAHMTPLEFVSLLILDEGETSNLRSRVCYIT